MAQTRRFFLRQLGSGIFAASSGIFAPRLVKSQPVIQRARFSWREEPRDIITNWPENFHQFMEEKKCLQSPYNRTRKLIKLKESTYWVNHFGVTGNRHPENKPMGCDCRVHDNSEFPS